MFLMILKDSKGYSRNKENPMDDPTIILKSIL
jgi:hypothetical protein